MKSLALLAILSALVIAALVRAQPARRLGEAADLVARTRKVGR